MKRGKNSFKILIVTDRCRQQPTEQTSGDSNFVPGSLALTVQCVLRFERQTPQAVDTVNEQDRLARSNSLMNAQVPRHHYPPREQPFFPARCNHGPELEPAFYCGSVSPGLGRCAISMSVRALQLLDGAHLGSAGSTGMARRGGDGRHGDYQVGSV